jgi:hypothetical protein
VSVPLDQVRRPQHVECLECGHTWVGFYLPMPIMDAARVMKALACPMCAADGRRIVISMAAAS